MSEKRFSLEHYDKMPYVKDNLNGDEYYLKWAVELMNELAEENEQLRKKCFELEKDYLIETSDISDKIYLGDKIKELKQRYGVDDE